MTWSDSLSLGNLEIDHQHRLFCEYLDHVVEACHQGKCRSEVEMTLQFLEFYARTHFASEEQWMQEVQYPLYQSHKALHNEFFARVSELRRELGVVGETITLVGKVNLLLFDWLTNHIKAADKDLVCSAAAVNL